MYFLLFIFAIIFLGCVNILREHFSGIEKLAKKNLTICFTVLCISGIVIFSIFKNITSNGSHSTSRYGIIENKDGTRKYYDKNKWKETGDGKHIYDKYGNVKDK